jgi:Integrase core domain
MPQGVEIWLPIRNDSARSSWFLTLAEVRKTIGAWRQYYNEYRPHNSLDQQMPIEFVAGWKQTRTDPKARFLTLAMVQ